MYFPYIYASIDVKKLYLTPCTDDLFHPRDVAEFFVVSIIFRLNKCGAQFLKLFVLLELLNVADFNTME